MKMHKYMCFKCHGTGKILLRHSTDQFGKPCRACYGRGTLNLERAAETLPIINNSFVREVDNEPLVARAFETLSLAQLESAIRESAREPDAIDCDSSRLMLIQSRGGTSLNVFRVGDDQYALMLVTSSGKYDEGRHYIQKSLSEFNGGAQFDVPPQLTHILRS